MIRHHLCWIFFLLMSNPLSGQTGQKSWLIPQIRYGFNWSAADLADRFGQHNSLGLGLGFRMADKAWQFDLSFDYAFGNQVKEDVIATLRSPEGFIYGNDKSIANIQLRQRGFLLVGKVGRNFSLSKKDKPHFLLISTGVGLLQHKVRIQDDPARFVPQLSEPYKKGYDQLSNGLALQQIIAFQRFAPNTGSNYYIGLELVESFTKNRRSVNFDSQTKDDKNRLDVVIGIRLGWMIPIEMGDGSSIYY